VHTRRQIASVGCRGAQSGFDCGGRELSIAGVLNEWLQDRAADFVSGAMPADERDGFEVLVAADAELRDHLGVLQEAANLALWRTAPAPVAPPAELKARILAAAGVLPQEKRAEAFVLADAGGRVVWVNDAFTELCGYSLTELRGRKPGELLQGPDTDPATVARLRAAQQARVACRAELVNYHKDGSRYRVSVRLCPLLDEAGEPLWFTARERQLA